MFSVIVKSHEKEKLKQNNTVVNTQDNNNP